MRNININRHLMLSTATFAAAGASFGKGATADKAANTATTQTAPQTAPTAGTNKPGAKKGVERVAPEITAVVTDVPMPEIKRATKSNYPFASLTVVGASFGIKNKKAVNMSSIIANQNKKPGTILATNPDGSPKMVQIDVRDTAGNVIGQRPEQEKVAPQFKAFDVDPAGDPAGASVRVFRTA